MIFLAVALAVLICCCGRSAANYPSSATELLSSKSQRTKAWIEGAHDEHIRLLLNQAATQVGTLGDVADEICDPDSSLTGVSYDADRAAYEAALAAPVFALGFDVPADFDARQGSYYRSLGLQECVAKYSGRHVAELAYYAARLLEDAVAFHQDQFCYDDDVTQAAFVLDEALRKAGCALTIAAALNHFFFPDSLWTTYQIPLSLTFFPTSTRLARVFFEENAAKDYDYNDLVLDYFSVTVRQQLPVDTVVCPDPAAPIRAAVLLGVLDFVIPRARGTDTVATHTRRLFFVRNSGPALKDVVSIPGGTDTYVPIIGGGMQRYPSCFEMLAITYEHRSKRPQYRLKHDVGTVAAYVGERSAHEFFLRHHHDDLPIKASYNFSNTNSDLPAQAHAFSALFFAANGLTCTTVPSNTGVTATDGYTGARFVFQSDHHALDTPNTDKSQLGSSSSSSSNKLEALVYKNTLSADRCPPLWMKETLPIDRPTGSALRCIIGPNTGSSCTKPSKCPSGFCITSNKCGVINGVVQGASDPVVPCVHASDNECPYGECDFTHVPYANLFLTADTLLDPSNAMSAVLQSGALQLFKLVPDDTSNIYQPQ